MRCSPGGGAFDERRAVGDVATLLGIPRIGKARGALPRTSRRAGLLLICSPLRTLRLRSAALLVFRLLRRILRTFALLGAGTLLARAIGGNGRPFRATTATRTTATAATKTTFSSPPNPRRTYATRNDGRRVFGELVGPGEHGRYQGLDRCRGRSVAVDALFVHIARNDARLARLLVYVHIRKRESSRACRPP